MNVKELEALRIGPDERLIIRLRDEAPDGFVEGLVKALVEMGLRDRALVLTIDDDLADFVVVER